MRIERGARVIHLYDGSHGTAGDRDRKDPGWIWYLRDGDPNDTGWQLVLVDHLIVEDADAVERDRRNKLAFYDSKRTDKNGAPCWCGYTKHENAVHTPHCTTMTELVRRTEAQAQTTLADAHRRAGQAPDMVLA